MKKERCGAANRDTRNIRQLAVQFLKFGLVGLSNNFVFFLVYYAIVFINAKWYLPANFAGWAISVFNAFYWSRRYVFKNSQSSFFRLLLKSYLSYGGIFLLSSVLLYVQVEMLGLSELLAPIIAIAVTIPASFIINKFWTFR